MQFAYMLGSHCIKCELNIYILRAHRPAFLKHIGESASRPNHKYKFFNKFIAITAAVNYNVKR